jgi:hypothetical protein
LKKLAFLGGAAGLGIVAILGLQHTSQAADHKDAPATKTNPLADINDVYAWNTTDAAQVNLAMSVSPEDDGTLAFGPSVQYVFHINSRAGFGMAGTESKIICTFTDDTHGQCWVLNPMGTVVDYVSGDLSGPNGRISASQKFRVFAGQRSDPFFFNFGGVVRAVGYALSMVCAGTSCPGTAHVDAAGCLDQLTKTQGNTIQTLLSTKAPADVPGTDCDDSADIDCFIDFNVKAIVIQIDKDELLLGTDKQVSVWASTHAGS